MTLLPLRLSGLLTHGTIRWLSLTRVALLLLILLLPILWYILPYPILMLITYLVALAWVALLASLLLLAGILVGVGVVTDVEVLSDGVEFLLGTVDNLVEERHC